MAIDTTDKAVKAPNVFEFKRKRNGTSYKAKQFAVAVSRKTRKGELVTKLVTTDFVALGDRAIDELLAAHEIDSCKAKILGANIILRRKAAGSGMQDELVLRMEAEKLLPNLDEKKRQVRFRAKATTILSLYREKQADGEKDYTIDKCYKLVTA